MPLDDRARLLGRYRELVLDQLPRRARAEGWVVTTDHCFGRILLDHAVGGRWYDVLDRCPVAGVRAAGRRAAASRGGRG